jgi:L-fucose mutarotase/ribose pyranase (RbsD/FucU family)
MSFTRLILAAGMAVAASGCALEQSAESDWRNAVARNVNQLGYRNWIVISEASFPAHSRIGVQQVNAPVEVPEALDYVLRTIEQTEHVKPRIYLPREMRSVENDYAPGIDDFRKRMNVALHANEVTEIDQEALITLMQDANKAFNVLVIRTTSALPYSSVFMELQPGYWDGDSESHLREKIQRERMNKLARPFP